MRTVNAKLVWLGFYIFCGMGAFKKASTDYLNYISVKWIQHRTKRFRFHGSSLAISAVQHILAKST